MPLVNRKPVKKIRLAQAAAMLGVSRSTVRNLIAQKRLEAIQPKPNTTSPIKVYEAQVRQIAEEGL